jgi:cysteine-rich repeat protein
MNIIRMGEVALLLFLTQSCQPLIGITDTNLSSATGGSTALDQCGDGLIQPNEGCDDGNQASGDGCSSRCQWEPVLVTVGGQQSCALGPNGVAKCWGDSRWGELGVWDVGLGAWDVEARGDDANEMGEALPALWLANGRKVKWVVTGHRHSCIALDDESISCWGGVASELDPNLSTPGTASLNFGKNVQFLSAGTYHTCALFEVGSLTCWGLNSTGQLGVGDSRDRDLLKGGAKQDDLRSVELGNGRRASAVAAGGSHTCAILEDHSLKCWGANDHGQLGIQNTSYRGIDPLDTESERTDVNLGSGRTARVVATGENHTCAILDNQALKCWGANDHGQLGLGDTVNRGGAPGDMGDALPEVNLGGAHAMALAMGESHTCALLDDDTVLCWGANAYGQLGQGDKEERSSAYSAEQGSSKTVDLGTGRHALQIASGYMHNCALLEDGSVKCWGRNEYGQLGVEDSRTRGDSTSEMGDQLEAVDLTF